jgi:hypothetical protein
LFGYNPIKQLNQDDGIYFGQACFQNDNLTTNISEDLPELDLCQVSDNQCSDLPNEMVSARKPDSLMIYNMKSSESLYPESDLIEEYSIKSELP